MSSPVTGPAGFTVRPEVGWAEGANDDAVAQVVVAVLPEGPPYALEGTARLIWLAVVEGGSTDDVVRRVAEAAEADDADIAHDVRTLLAELVDLGLLAAPRT